jgi:predicted PurR-regulated permease PerM
MLFTTILLICIIIFLIGNILLYYLEKNTRQLPINNNMSQQIMSSKIDVLHNKINNLEKKLKK